MRPSTGRSIGGRPGLYHINAVDTVTQWQMIGCVETISENHLLPVLEAMLHQFPFVIRGFFHCDNGSEFINHQVAGMVDKLRVEFTKSRAYRTTDNALVEGKKGASIRKGLDAEQLKNAAKKLSGTGAARKMQQAKLALLEQPRTPWPRSVLIDVRKI